MARSIDDVADRGKDKKWEDELKWLDTPGGEFVTGRLVGDVLPYAKHWIEFISKKTNKRTTFPLDCPRFNPDTEEYNRPQLEMGKDGKPKLDDEGKPIPLKDKKGNVKLVLCKCCDANIKGNASCLLWVIDYRLVEDGNSNPVRALRIPLGTVREIKQLKQLNRVKNEETGKTEPVSVMHEKYGCQVNIKYDPDAKGPSKWSIGKGDRLPLTKAERKLVKKLRNFEDIIFFPDQTKVEADLKRIGYLNEDGSINEDRESLDPRDAERNAANKSKSKPSKGSEDSPKAKGKRVSVSSEDDDDSESETDSEPKAKTKKGHKPTDSDDEADSDAKAKSKSKKSKKASSSEGDTDSDADSDSEPKSKGKKGKAKDSSEEDDSDEDSDSAPKSKGKKGKAKASSEDDDDSDAAPKSKGKKGKAKDSSEEDDLDSEDLPDPRKGKSVGKAAKKGKAKDSSSEDDADSEDDDDSEDSDAKGKSKKAKGKKGSDDDSDSAAKSKGKKKSKKASSSED